MRLRRSWRPSSVIFGKRWLVGWSGVGMLLLLHCVGNRSRGLAVAQDPAVDLARGRLGQLLHEGDDTWKLVLAQPIAREALQLVDVGVAGRTLADDEGLGDLTAGRVRHANDGGLSHVWML